MVVQWNLGYTKQKRLNSIFRHRDDQYICVMENNCSINEKYISNICMAVMTNNGNP